MGLKSGSRDAELDDEESEEQDSEQAAVDESADEAAPADATTDRVTRVETNATSESTAATTGPPATSAQDDDRPSMSSIPYKLRRDKVNDGRSQVPFFLRDEVLEGEGDLQDALESELGEDVYKSDYREAAMVLAQRRPELVAEILREWGYDLDAV